MDEPFTGLDPVNVRLLKEAFLEMRDRGKTLIFSTHQMETVEELCESIAIIDQGRVVVSGPVRDVKRAMGRQVVRARDRRPTGTAPIGSTRAGTVSTSTRPSARTSSSSACRPDRDPETILRAALDARRRVTALRDRRAEPGGDLHRARRRGGGRRG